MAKNIHLEPFDEATKIKLAIFEDYLKEWLPVFLGINQPFWKTINIFDFFAGPGTDSIGTQGTPLIILNHLNKYKHAITSKHLSVNVFFNEFDIDKYHTLQENINTIKSEDYTVTVENLDFQIAFPQYYSKMNDNVVNLLFLDQNGVKHITKEVFSKIINLKQTDFIFYISSSYINRFVEEESFARHLNINRIDIKNKPFSHIHNVVLDYYKSLIPSEKEYYIAPFSIKKGANIYGLIFGSNHPLGMEKFLNTCWKADPERGNANFDIDGDNIKPGQRDLFTGDVPKPKKVEVFEQNLEALILTKQIITNKDVYIYTITKGFTLSHARKVIKNLYNNKKIKNQTLNLTNLHRKDSIIKTIELT